MNSETKNKLLSIQNKIRNIHNSLQNTTLAETKICETLDNNDYIQKKNFNETTAVNITDQTSIAISNNTGILKRVIKLIKQRSDVLKDFGLRQNFYAHCSKLVTLFIIALVHLFFIRSFLNMLSLLEDYVATSDSKYSSMSYNQLLIKQNYANDNSMQILQAEIEILNNYKKNVWMTVAAMCVALSTSCFFFFILPITYSVHYVQLILIVIIDLVAFAALPALLITRLNLILHVIEHLPDALRSAHHAVSAEKLMNALQCTIYPREKLPFCSELILNSIFPIILLKYLIILCIISLVYILLAYLIDYCIRHRFPHKKFYYSPYRQQNYNSDCCFLNYNHCCIKDCTHCNYSSQKNLCIWIANEKDFVFNLKNKIPTFMPNPLINKDLSTCKKESNYPKSVEIFLPHSKLLNNTDDAIKDCPNT